MTGDRAHRLCLGWQYAMPCPDPGPPPRRPTPPDAERLNPEWAAAQRREEKHLNRPLRAAVVAGCVIGLALAGFGTLGWVNVIVAGLGVICCVLIAAVGGYAIWQGRRVLRSRLAQEQARVSKMRATQESELFASQAEHARRLREWQALRVAYEHQKRWYAVCAPGGIQRVDVAGGTLSGWSALLTTTAAPRLAAGGEVTVIDLSEGSAALDLLGFARASGIEPLVRVLPDDLARLDVGLGLGQDALADVLSQAAGASEPVTESARNPWLDNAILERVIDALGGTGTVASVSAALRVLAQVGDPREDVAAGLISAAQVDRLGTMFRRGATGRIAFERAWILEAQLRKLAALGTDTDPAAPSRSALRVIALGRLAGAAEGKVLGTYLAAALTYALRGTRPEPPWQHALYVLAADRLPDDTLDRLCDACESAGTGLVLAFRVISPPVRARLGRGGAAVGYMRLGSAEDAKAASEQLGAEHRVVLPQLTETISQSVTDITAGSYTSPAGPQGQACEDDEDGGSFTKIIAASTAWGMTTAEAASDGESLAQAMQRFREFGIEQHELQRLPASAMIITYAGPSGRQVILADVNPGIGGLSAATGLTLEEYRGTPAVTVGAGAQAARDADGRGAEAGNGRPLPNVGPPQPRLDWRKRRS